VQTPLHSPVVAWNRRTPTATLVEARKSDSVEGGVAAEPSMRLHFDNEWLRRKIAAAPDEEPEAGIPDPPRFFIEHGMIHDRETGKHVTTDEDSWTTPEGKVMPNPHGSGVSATCELLNQLATPRHEPEAFRAPAPSREPAQASPPEHWNCHKAAHGKWNADGDAIELCPASDPAALDLYLCESAPPEPAQVAGVTDELVTREQKLNDLLYRMRLSPDPFVQEFAKELSALTANNAQVAGDQAVKGC
jgi:hypothetical protein